MHLKTVKELQMLHAWRDRQNESELEMEREGGRISEERIDK